MVIPLLNKNEYKLFKRIVEKDPKDNYKILVLKLNSLNIINEFGWDIKSIDDGKNIRYFSGEIR
jgi:hypothetical protein